MPPDGALSMFKTYGFLLVVGIVCGMVVFKKELRRKEKLGLFGYQLTEGENGYKGVFTQVFLNTHMIFVVFFAFIGAKTFSVLEKFPAFLKAPIETIKATGTAAYGGIVFGLLASFYFFKKSKIPMLPVIDCMGPTLMLSTAIVRMGCYFSGDGCWGVAATAKPAWWFLPNWAWESYYPHNILNKGSLIEGCTFHYNRILETPVFPTSLYEATITFLMFCLLWAVRKRAFNPGFLFGIFLMLNGIERFFIEFIRVNEKHLFLGIQLSQAQIVALILFICGLIWSFLIARGPKAQRVGN